MTRLHRIAWLLLALACSGCASLSNAQRDAAQRIAVQGRSADTTCDAADACARPSPLRALGDEALAASTPAAPRHYAVLLDRVMDDRAGHGASDDSAGHGAAEGKDHS